MRYALALDADGDGWPEGSGNIEREGMGPEKLDVAVYTIRGLLDLADMARAKGDRPTAAWATHEAVERAQRFERTWWYGGDADSYADSLPIRATSSCTSGTGSERRRWRPSFQTCGVHGAADRWHRCHTPPSD
jgi:hypothetical protein